VMLKSQTDSMISNGKTPTYNSTGTLQNNRTITDTAGINRTRIQNGSKVTDPMNPRWDSLK
jgi:hypothetical protein